MTLATYRVPCRFPWLTWDEGSPRYHKVARSSRTVGAPTACSPLKPLKCSAAMVYAGGAPTYRARCDQVAANGYEGFDLR